MSSDSDSWVPELLESHLHGHDPENDIEEMSFQQLPAQRGPKKIPIMWSQVVCVSEDVDVEVEIRPIEADMLAMSALPRPPRARRAEDWKPLFLPTEYAKAHPEICLEQYRLGDRRLKTLGEEITKHRKRLREKALAFDKSQAMDLDRDVHDISALASN